MFETTRIVVKFVPTESPYRRQQQPVRVFDPLQKRFVETGSTSGKRKPSNVTETLRFAPSRRTGRYLTGLEELIPNHLKSSTVIDIRGKYNLSDKWDKYLEEIVKQDSISRQRYYEILDGAEPEFYTPIVPASIRNSQNTVFRTSSAGDQTFIERFELTLYEGSNVFTTETQRGRLAIQLLRNHPEVARTRDVMNRDIHRFYIAEEDEEARDRIEVSRKENDAIEAFNTLVRKHNPVRLYQFGVTLGVVRGAVSESAVYDQLDRYIKNKVTTNERVEKMAKLEKFLDLYEILDKNFNLFISKFMVKQAMNISLIYPDAGRLVWKTQRENPALASWKDEELLAGYLATELDKYEPDENKRKKVHQDNGFATMRENLSALGVKIDL